MADAQDKSTSSKSSINTAKAKKRLLEMREQLEGEIETKVAQVAEDGDDLVPERGGVSNHMADEANDTAEQETMMTIQRSLEAELDRVNAALQRIEDGTFGICTNCGKPISAARLEARPSSPLCIDCQRLEDEGRL